MAKPPRDYLNRGLLADYDFRTSARGARSSKISDPESLRRAYGFFNRFENMQSRDPTADRTGNLTYAGEQVIMSYDFTDYPNYASSGRSNTLPFNDENYDIYLLYGDYRVRVVSGQHINSTLRSVVGDLVGYDQLTKFFSGRDLRPDQLEFTIEITRDSARSNIGLIPFRARANDVRSKYYGVLGRSSNCVVKAIYQRVAYYYEDNTTKRDYMWIGDTKKGLTKHEPYYDAAAVKLLQRDSTYKKVKDGYETFLREFDYSPLDHPGFDIRDLIRLADYMEVGICIWTVVGGQPWRRLNTQDYQYHTAKQMRVFHFYMSSTQHLELMNSQGKDHTLFKEFHTYARLDGPIDRTNISLDNHKVAYLDDAGMKGLFDGSTKHLHTLNILRKNPVCGEDREAAERDGELYRDFILMDGDTVYKHRAVEEFLDRMARDDPDEGQRYYKRPADYLYVTGTKDLDYVKLKRLYKEKHITRISQRSDPRLFMAAALSDSTVGHVLYGDNLKPGDDIYSYDGHKWYATEMNEFPYFHGYPLRSHWHEYDGVKAAVDLRDFDKPLRNFIGNAPGDTPFTFGYGKYAIFQMESIDLSTCDVNTRSHFERDKIFQPITEGCVRFLTSPVVHFLQDNGAIWRASRVWVSYSVSPHWCPDVDLWWDIKRNKSYQPIIGKFMSGSNNIQERDYIVPDLETAKELAFWYSQRFITQLEDTTCPELEAGKRMLRRDIDPSTIMGDYDMVLRCTGSYLMRGGEYTALKYTKAQTEYEFPDMTEGATSFRIVPEEGSPYRVHVTEDLNGFNAGYQHISGAIHAYCFVRLYSAILRIPASEVVGMSVDCIKTRSDCREYLGDMFSEEYKNGCFKSEPVKPYVCPVYLTRLLSGHEYPAHYLEGIYSKSLVSVPKWNSYKDGFTQFNIVTGPAGSGKTTRHFTDFGSSDIEKDFRLDTSKVVYMTLTNYLSIEMGKKLGVTAYTSFKGMNRVVNDQKHHTKPEERFNKCLHWHHVFDLDRIKGKHTIFLDEVSMQEPEKVLDMIRVCYAYGVQLFITGDITADGTLYQLGPIFGGATGLFASLCKAQQELGIEFNWIQPMGLFRQADDRELADLLTQIREVKVLGSWPNFVPDDTPWRLLYDSPLFEHVELEEMLKRFVIGRDMAVNPVHHNLATVTRRLFVHSVFADTLIPMRCNLEKPEKVQAASEFLKGFIPVLSDGSVDSSYEMVTKGMTRTATSAQLVSVKERHMKHGFPYHKTNDVNPMLAVTVHNLQGLTIKDDSVLYLCYEDGGAPEWGISGKGDPRLVYVAASRVRRRQQLVLVRLPARQGGHTGFKRRAF